MISPGGIPQIPGDMDVLAGHATALSGVGASFASTGERVNSTWQQLAPVYDAPEVGQLLAATGPVQTTSASVGEDITTVGGALATYASTVKQIQDQLDALRTQAQDLVAEADADKANEGGLEKVGEFVGIGGDDDEYAERSNELVGQVNAQVAAFDEAQRVCANTINALYGGGIQYRADDGDGHREAGEFGYTAEQLDAAVEQGQELPWGTYAETDTGIVGGVWDGAKMFVGDLGALIGRDPVTGQWSWATAGTAWKGLGTFALAIGVYATPGGSIIDQQFNDGALGNTLINAGKGIIAYDEWGKGDNARAAGMATFNVLSAIVGTKGAGAGIRGAGAGAQTSRIGAVSRAGGAMVRSGEFIGRLPTTDSLVLKVRQHLPNLRLPGNIPDINTPHHTDTPSPHAPSVDPPRADTPNPGSVGDNLSNRTPNIDTPSTPDVDVPGPRGDTPDSSAATPDPSPQHADPAGNGAAPEGPAHQTDTPATDREPALVGAGNDTEPTPGTGNAPAGHTPGDSPPDDTPGDLTAGDTTPGDATPGDATPTDTPDSAQPSEDAPYAGPTGTRPDGSWIGEDHGTRLDLDPADNAAANEFLARAATAEPTITPRMQSILGEHMEGYEFRLKGEDSLKRKIAMDRADAPDAAPDALTESINDAIRYTAKVPDGGYVRESQRIIDEMHAQGFEFQPPPKNAWNNDGNYQGINSTWKDPATGQLFEMQFHTPESFAAKQTTHDLYEQARLLPKRSTERLALMRQQAEIFSNVPRPEGTAGIRFSRPGP